LDGTTAPPDTPHHAVGFDTLSGSAISVGSSILNTMTSVSLKTPGKRKTVTTTYSQDNILKMVYPYLLPGAVVVFGGLCYVSIYLFESFQKGIENFYYRMLSFAFATCFTAIALHCYVSVSPRHE
jgi:hypothetical protein